MRFAPKLSFGGPSTFLSFCISGVPLEMPGRGQRSAPRGGVGNVLPAPALETLADAAGAMEVGVEAFPVAPAAPVPSPEGPGVSEGKT